MSAATHLTTRPAYDDEGDGMAVVLLHGLTFDRRTWRPIVERLGGSVRTIAVDLPAHGESAGAPAPLEEVADAVHDLVVSLDLERPIVVGHSMSGGLAVIYAAVYPTRGLVVIDQGPELAPFAELVQRLAPALRGPGFAHAWQQFERSLALDRIPEPERTLVLDTHVVQQDVVVGYWAQLMEDDPAELQAWADSLIPRVQVPGLGVFGRPATEGERERFERLTDFHLEEWSDAGHFVHLVEPDRFAATLLRFVAHCSGAA